MGTRRLHGPHRLNARADGVFAIVMSYVHTGGRLGRPAVAGAAAILVVTSLLSDRLHADVLQPEFADIDPLARRRTVIAPLVNAVVYALSVAAAFVLPLLGLTSASATLLWLLLPLNRLVTNRLARA